MPDLEEIAVHKIIPFAAHFLILPELRNFLLEIKIISTMFFILFVSYLAAVAPYLQEASVTLWWPVDFKSPDVHLVSGASCPPPLGNTFLPQDHWLQNRTAVVDTSMGVGECW